MLRCVGYYDRTFCFPASNRYPAGSTFKAVAKITANHMGHFEFRLCPLADQKELETEECFARYPLIVEGGGTSYYLPHKQTGDLEVEVTLPDIKCEQCVLQWTYVTGW
jgi:hypothetical protein